MNLRNMMLSKRSQVQKTTYSIILFIEYYTTGKTVLIESKEYVLTRAEDGGGGLTAKEQEETLG